MWINGMRLCTGHSSVWSAATRMAIGIPRCPPICRDGNYFQADEPDERFDG